MFGRTKVAMLVAEFLGTATLTAAVLAVASVANPRFGLPTFFVASAAGLAVGLMVLLVGKNSGAHLNPAITLGHWSLRKIPTTQAIAYIATQLLGGLAALGLYQYLTGQATGSQFGAFAGQGFRWQVLVAEAVGAFIFAFAVAAAIEQRYEGWTLATVIGVSLMLGMVTASVASNGLVNPALALGFRSISRAYIIGPLVGGLVGMNLYHYLFVPAPARVAAKATSGRGRSRTAAKKPAKRRKSRR